MPPGVGSVRLKDLSPWLRIYYRINPLPRQAVPSLLFVPPGRVMGLSWRDMSSGVGVGVGLAELKDLPPWLRIYYRINPLPRQALPLLPVDSVQFPVLLLLFGLSFRPLCFPSGLQLLCFPPPLGSALTCLLPFCLPSWSHGMLAWYESDTGILL